MKLSRLKKLAVSCANWTFITPPNTAHGLTWSKLNCPSWLTNASSVASLTRKRYKSKRQLGKNYAILKKLLSTGDSLSLTLEPSWYVSIFNYLCGGLLVEYL